MGQVEEVAGRHVLHPHLLDGEDQFRQGGGVKPGSLQLQLHVRPAIFYWIQVWRITRPVQDRELGLHLLQPVHDNLAGVTRGAVLEKELGAMDSHEGTEVVLQNCFVAWAVYGTVLGKKVKASPALLATKTPPHHDTGTVLDRGDGVSLLVAGDPSGPPHDGSPRVHQAKRRFN